MQKVRLHLDQSASDHVQDADLGQYPGHANNRMATLRVLGPGTAIEVGFGLIDLSNGYVLR